MKKLIIHLLFIIVVLLGSALEGFSKSYYNSASNQFGGLFLHPGMRMQGRYKAINGNLLIEENATMATALSLDTLSIHSTAYRYQLRLANLNNKQGKTLTIKDPMTGKKTQITSPEWGLVFNRDEEGNYCAVVLSCDNSSPYDDITDQRSMHVTLIQRQNGETSTVATTEIKKGVSLEDEMNTLCVDVDEHGVIIMVGKDELKQVLEAHIKRPLGPVQVGYQVGPGTRMALERAVLTIDNEKQVITTTQWTRETLDEYFAASKDPVEGYWTYLDRDMEDRWLRLGGRYTIAVVRADDGYDLIYIDGAQVKKSLWQPGMKKGHMTRTIFSGNYDASWIDATMEPLDKDVQATIENGVILTLNFPVYKSQVRFAKVLDVKADD